MIRQIPPIPAGKLLTRFKIGNVWILLQYWHLDLRSSTPPGTPGHFGLQNGRCVLRANRPDLLLSVHGHEPVYAGPVAPPGVSEQTARHACAVDPSAPHEFAHRDLHEHLTEPRVSMRPVDAGMCAQAQESTEKRINRARARQRMQMSCLFGGAERHVRGRPEYVSH